MPKSDPQFQKQFQFDQTSISVVAGRESTLDQTTLHIKTLSDADEFVKSYGFNLENEQERERLWYFHRRALVLINERLKYKLEEIPEPIRQPEKLVDLRNLLIWSSNENPKSDSDKQLQRWSCAVLRCMHVFIHTETDLYNSFSEEILRQTVGPIEKAVQFSDKLYLKSENETIELSKFDVKPVKTAQSTVIKLLAKPDTSALTVFDKIGFRFITYSVYDVFRVIRFLVSQHLMSFAHIMPDQSSNNMYPAREFLDFCEEVLAHPQKYFSKKWPTNQEIDTALELYLKSNESRFLNFFRKENNFSAKEFKYIKFICRRLVKVPISSVADKSPRMLQFFYPFEVQIMTNEVFEKVQTGESEHAAYKNRQIEAARKRILP